MYIYIHKSPYVMLSSVSCPQLQAAFTSCRPLLRHAQLLPPKRPRSLQATHRRSSHRKSALN